MRTVVIGAAGQLGSELIERLGDDAVGLAHEQVEVSDAVHVERALSSIRPELLINAAAYNLVDRAEDEPERACAVNAFGPRNLARWCEQHGAVLMHVSTDYVFGVEAARRDPYRETDAPGPLSAYGISKLAGEYFVQSLCPRHFIVRTCGLYGGALGRGSGNFVETMLRLGRAAAAVKVVTDQRCTPTSAGDLAETMIELAASGRYGLYHATNAGETTWHEFAQAVFAEAGLDVDAAPVTSAEFGARAPRPPYSVLDCSKLESVLGRSMRPWREALREYVNAAAESPG